MLPRSGRLQDISLPLWALQLLSGKNIYWNLSRAKWTQVHTQEDSSAAARYRSALSDTAQAKVITKGGYFQWKLKRVTATEITKHTGYNKLPCPSQNSSLIFSQKKKKKLALYS